MQGDVLTACLAVLGDDPGLLVVDNCEHLLGAVRDTVGTILAACPRLTVLTTSREPLGLAAEHAFRLAPLPLPDAADEGDLAHVASVAVFLDRAARVRPGHRVTPDELRTVADIVRQLDGMPLAIELAARRLSTFSLADLQARLHRALDLLGDGRASTDTRHRTLRATVEWSYQLLSLDQQRLFRHLSVFADGVDLDGAEHVASGLCLRDDPGIALARLVDASMIEADFAGGRTRYRMLETLRAFGLDRLAAAGETDEAAERMLQWAVELTDWIAVTLRTELEPDADRVLRREVANLRAAWQIARGRGAFDEAAALITAPFAGIGHRDLIEIRGWAEELADEFLTAHLRSQPILARPVSWGRQPKPRTSGATTRARSGWRAPVWSGRPMTRDVCTACSRCRWPSWPAVRTPMWSSTRSPQPGSRPRRARPWASPPWRRRIWATSTGHGISTGARSLRWPPSPTMRGARTSRERSRARPAGATWPSGTTGTRSNARAMRERPSSSASRWWAFRPSSPAPVGSTTP